MHLHHRDFVARVFDAGFFIGALGCNARGVKITAVPGIVLALQPVRQRKLQRLHSDDVLLAHRLRNFRRRDDGAGRTVGHAAAIEQAERLGNHRRVQALFFGDGLLQMRLGILRAVGVALHRHMRDGALQIASLKRRVWRDRRRQVARSCQAPIRWRSTAEPALHPRAAASRRNRCPSVSRRRARARYRRRPPPPHTPRRGMLRNRWRRNSRRA